MGFRCNLLATPALALRERRVVPSTRRERFGQRERGRFLMFARSFPISEGMWGTTGRGMRGYNGAFLRVLLWLYRSLFMLCVADCIQ